jgi:hypothetical protein
MASLESTFFFGLLISLHHVLTHNIGPRSGRISIWHGPHLLWKIRTHKELNVMSRLCELELILDANLFVHDSAKSDDILAKHGKKKYGIIAYECGHNWHFYKYHFLKNLYPFLAMGWFSNCSFRKTPGNS